MVARLTTSTSILLPCCEPPTQSGKALAVVIHNPIPRGRTSYVRLPVNASAWLVQDATLAPVASQVNKNLDAPLPGRPSAAPMTLVFAADLPPLGFATFFVTPVDDQTPSASVRATIVYAWCIFSRIGVCVCVVRVPCVCRFRLRVCVLFISIFFYLKFCRPMPSTHHSNVALDRAGVATGPVVGGAAAAVGKPRHPSRTLCLKTKLWR